MCVVLVTYFNSEKWLNHDKMADRHLLDCALTGPTLTRGSLE